MSDSIRPHRRQPTRLPCPWDSPGKNTGAQLFVFTFLGATECFLLAAMAYDRYVAICLPLRYAALVSWGACVRLAAACWLGGFLTPVLPVYLMSRLTFCGRTHNTKGH